MTLPAPPPYSSSPLTTIPLLQTPVDDQTEADVSQIACSEIEANDKNYVMCFLQDPLPEEPSKFGIKLDTMSLTDTEEITLTANVSAQTV